MYKSLNFNKYKDNIKYIEGYDNNSNCSYVLTTIKRNVSANERIFARVRTTYNDENKIESLHDYMNKENVLFSINAGIFNTGSGKPECLLIIDCKVLVDQSETYIHTSLKDGGDKRYELYILGIDKEGELHIFDPGTSSKEILDFGCVDAVMGFVPLITDYNAVDVDDKCSYISYEKHPRQIIGIDKDNNYFVLTVNNPGMSLNESRNLLKSMNVKLAYNLDGGSSTQTVFYKENITPIYREETGRKIPTVINFEVITGDLIIE